MTTDVCVVMVFSGIRQSILAKVSIIILFTSTITLGSVGVWEYTTTRDRLKNALTEQAKMLSDRLALGFVKIVWDYDQKLAESFIYSEMNEKSISGILVWEEGEENALFGGWRSKSGDVIFAKAPLSEEYFMKSESMILRHSRPIGKVRVYLTDRLLNQSLRTEMRTTFTRVILLDAVMIIILIVLIRSYLIRPMSKIRAAMEGMQEGELNQIVAVRSSDEIGQIAASFNTMAVKLNMREKQLLESEEKFSTLVNHAADALFLHDMNGAFLDVNQSSCKSLGYSREELLKMRVCDVDINYSDKAAIQKFSTRLHAGTPLTIESVHQRKDGTTFPVEVRLGVIQIRGERTVLAVARDISERKIAEAALKKARDELALKVAERTVELSVAKDQAEAANIAKSDFLARMSHEIRTPLNAVTGLTNILTKSQLTEEQREYLNKIEIASNNLMAVINDVLDFSKVEAGRIELTNGPMDLGQLLERLADLFSDRVAQKDLELLIDSSPQVPGKVIGDSARLTQVLTNLIENAVKFTETGEILLKVELDLETEALVDIIPIKFMVKDTGIGIQSDILPTLFEPFTQVDSSLTRKHGGTGLGLAICRQLVALMGGGMWAESAEGQGSTFGFTIMFELQKEVAPRFIVPKTFNGFKALVVDDSPTARQLMEDLLLSFNFAVTSLDNGPKAIEELRNAASENEPYQLVLLDWKMPGMDGIETACLMRETELTIQTPSDHTDSFVHSHFPAIIIMVTAYGKKRIRARINSDTVDHILTKPIKPSELFNAVMGLFGLNGTIATSNTTSVHGHLGRLEGRRVMVVEDSLLNLDVAMALLVETGLTVDTAENGKTAVDKITRSEPGFYDAVLMDIQMPVMDGYEATRHIRKWERNAQGVRYGDYGSANLFEQTDGGPESPPSEPQQEGRMPIIALTAHALAGEKGRCLDAGMDDYLAKPIDEKALHRVLYKWIAPAPGEGGEI